MEFFKSFFRIFTSIHRSSLISNLRWWFWNEREGFHVFTWILFGDSNKDPWISFWFFRRRLKPKINRYLIFSFFELVWSCFNFSSSLFFELWSLEFLELELELQWLSSMMKIPQWISENCFEFIAIDWNFCYWKVRVWVCSSCSWRILRFWSNCQEREICLLFLWFWWCVPFWMELVMIGSFYSWHVYCPDQ